MKNYFFAMLMMCFFFSCEKAPEQVSPKQQPPATTGNPLKNLSPNARIGGHIFWYFYRGNSTNTLRYAYSDNGRSWSGDQPWGPSPVGSSTGPTVIKFNGGFFAAFIGASSGNLYVTASEDGINWQEARQVLGQKGSGSPALSLDSFGRVQLFYTGYWGGIGYTNSSDGFNWTPIRPLKENGNYAYSVGALASEGVTVYYHDSFGIIKSTTIGGPGTPLGQPNGPVSTFRIDGLELRTEVGVSVVRKPSGALLMAYKGDLTDRLYVYDGDTGQVYWTNASTSNRPSLVRSGSGYRLAFKGSSTSTIYVAISPNGTTWTSNAAIGLTYDGGPSLVDAQP